MTTVPFQELYDVISRDKKIVISVAAREKLPVGLEVVHQEISFALPYTADLKEKFTKRIMNRMPIYDTVVWRVPPEISYFRHMGYVEHPITLSAAIDIGPCDPKKYKPSVAKVYLRLSLINEGRQVTFEQNRTPSLTARED